MTTYHLKKRVDIVAESLLTQTILDCVDAAAVPGYSVFPMLAGRGMLNQWTSEGQVSNAANMVGIFCVVDPTQVDAVVDTVLSIIRDRVGFVTVSDVAVVRPERF